MFSLDLHDWRSADRLAAWLCVGVALMGAGCGDSAPPQPVAPDDGGRFEGYVDPSAASFVLESLECPVPGQAPVRIDLIGRDLAVDPETEQVTLEVAVRSADRRSLFAPLEVVVGRFQPSTVAPINADWRVCRDSLLPPELPDTTWPSNPPPPEHPGACRFGFDYSHLIGADSMLAAGETSRFRSWVLRDPGLVAFSFAATARFTLEPEDPPEPPGSPYIAGRFFHDVNENGRPDPDEGPFPGGWVEVHGPGIEAQRVRVGAEGWYRILVRRAGLYTLTGSPPPDMGIQQIGFTTPNPLEVILIPGPDGTPQSFRGAHFGVARDVPPGEHPRVILMDALPDSIPRAPYSLARIGLNGDLLTLRVGYSGCQPRHPFRLFMVGGFMESWPVQARLELVHDDLGEDCTAAFDTALTFDLRPIQRAYAQSYGEPGTVILQFVDYRGQVHRIEYIP